MSTHPLLAPLTEPQRAVVDIVSAVWLRHGQFPVYRHVEQEMDGVSFVLEEVLPTFPGIGKSQFGPRYRAVWWDNVSNGAPDRPVGLSIVGLTFVADATAVVQLYLEALSALAARRRDAVSDPFTAEDPSLTRDELFQAISRSRDPNSLRAQFEAARSLANYEPPTSGTSWDAADQADSVVRCTRKVRHFADVEDVFDYVVRLDAYLTPAAAPLLTPPEEPPLALATELDYLDAVWRLYYRTDNRLLNLPSASAVSTLTNDANTADQFDARMNALGQVLKAFQVQATGSHPVQRLRARLVVDVGEPSRDRVQSAADALEAAVAIRNGGAHTRAAPAAVEALKSFGIAYPITDWAEAWRAIRSAVSRAIATLREELQASI